MTKSKTVDHSYAVADPDAPANVIKPNADGSINTSLSTANSTSLNNASSGYTTSSTALTSGQAVPAGRGILVVTTLAGNATLTFGGIDILFTFVVGPTILPLAITKYTAGTATASFYNIS